MTAALAGLSSGLALIVAIGAQNAYVLRQGLLRSHVLPVVLVCTASDLVLIGAGVGGIGAVVDRAGWAIEIVRWLGVAFLLWYAVGSLWRARTPARLTAESGAPRGRVLGRAIALTWLNPHVYLDTVLLLGSLAAAYGSGGRWWFATGAMAASVLWFAGLGYGARLLAPALARPRAWQVLDVVIAVIMVTIALRLAFGVRPGPA